MDKKSARIRRATRTRYNLRKLGVIRLVVHRTSRHIYAQIISSDYGSKVLVCSSTVEKFVKDQLQGLIGTGNKNAAAIVGKTITERALKKNIKNISFDRSGFKYHGRVKSLADAARKAGLEF